MANGFKALRHVGGGVQRYSELPINAATSAIYNGDVVQIVTGELEQAATNTAMQGSFVGCMYVNAKGEQKFSANWDADASATDIYGLFNADTGVSYKVESDVTLLPGALCDLVVGTGNDSTGQSGSTVTTSTNGDFVVKSVIDDANKIYEVAIV